MDSKKLSTSLILQGHCKSIACTKFSPNGKLLASSSADNTCMVWDADTGIYYRTLKGHTGGISTVAWTPDSRRLYSASDDTTVGIWDIEANKRVGSLTGHLDIAFAVDCSPHGDCIASGGFDSTVKLWDPRTNKSIRSMLAHTDPVTSVNFNRDGSLLVTSSFDGLVRVWDVKSGHCLRTIVQDQNPPVSSAKFSPNGKFILAGSFGGVLHLWNYAQNKSLRRYRHHIHERFCINSTFRIYKDEKTAIVSGSENGKVYIWDLQTKTVLHRLSGHSDAVVAVDAHPSNGSIVSGELCSDETNGSPVVRIWKPVKNLEESRDPLYISAPATSSMFKFGKN